MSIEIVILAMIAVFLALRLYAVLGKRAEHGEEPTPRRFDTPQGGIGASPPVRPAAERANDRANDRAPERAGLGQPLGELALSPGVERGLRAISAADRRFDVGIFIEGARGAYRMILEAFWAGDRDALAQLCDGDVAASFGAAIDARLKAGEVLDNRLVRITTARISAASIAAPIARITVDFVADIAAVTRDGAGHAIAGSLTDAVEVRDAWTFTRNLSRADPDWLLDETDEH